MRTWHKARIADKRCRRNERSAIIYPPRIESIDGVGDVFALKIARKEAYSLRGHFGYLVAPETLLHGTAGWATFDLN